MDDPQGAACPHAWKAHEAHPRPGPPVAAGPASKPRLSIVAYEKVGPQEGAILRMPPRRRWMDQTGDRGAYRCLPLVVANQAGWAIRNPLTFRVTWNGGPASGDLAIEVPEGQPGWGGGPEGVISSHFGSGILTFQVPYLFRTPAGYNLWVKGPANCFKDGVQALEGIVETDWSHSPFTMNWKLTRKDHPVVFREGELICQVLPYPRGLIERFDPEIRAMESEPGLQDAYDRWASSRGEFLETMAIPGSEAQTRGWQKDYFRGRRDSGERFDDHQTALPIREFVRTEPEAGTLPPNRE